MRPRQDFVVSRFRYRFRKHRKGMSAQLPWSGFNRTYADWIERARTEMKVPLNGRDYEPAVLAK